jgi:hypothetical protein
MRSLITWFERYGMAVWRAAMLAALCWIALEIRTVPDYSGDLDGIRSSLDDLDTALRNIGSEILELRNR